MKSQITEVPNTILNDEADSFQFLDSELENVKLVGIGEATHGTEEFKVLQCNLFKYLVKNQGYNTFFLEDEYLYGLPIDAYIKGAEGNVDSLVSELRNWPWKTQQLKSLISWMRAYNENHDNILSFVGVDFQDQKQFRKYLEREFDIETADKDLEEIIESLDALQNNTQVDLFRQSLVELSLGDRRDFAMGQLIIKYLDLYKHAKGVFCAHNTHLLKVFKDRKNDKRDRMWAGGLLDDRLKEKFYVLFTDFDAGEFYAYALKENTMSKRKFNNHELKVNKAVCQNKKYSLCKYLNGNNAEIIFVSDLHNNEATKKWATINSIGAAYYGKKNDKTMHNHIDFVSPDLIDGILFFKKTTAARLLDR